MDKIQRQGAEYLSRFVCLGVVPVVLMYYYKFKYQMINHHFLHSMTLSRSQFTVEFMSLSKF